MQHKKITVMKAEGAAKGTILRYNPESALRFQVHTYNTEQAVAARGVPAGTHSGGYYHTLSDALEDYHRRLARASSIERQLFEIGVQIDNPQGVEQ
jgi:hypothetical protein